MVLLKPPRTEQQVRAASSYPGATGLVLTHMERLRYQATVRCMSDPRHLCWHSVPKLPWPQGAKHALNGKEVTGAWAGRGGPEVGWYKMGSQVSDCGMWQHLHKPQGLGPHASPRTSPLVTECPVFTSLMISQHTPRSPEPCELPQERGQGGQKRVHQSVRDT